MVRTRGSGGPQSSSRYHNPLPEERGRVSETLANVANDVYVGRGERGEILLPARVEVIQSIDPAAGLMIVKLLPGLIE